MKTIAKFLFLLLMATMTLQAAAKDKYEKEKEACMKQFVSEVKEAYKFPIPVCDGVTMTDVSHNVTGVNFHFTVTDPNLYETFSQKNRKVAGQIVGPLLAKLIPLNVRFGLYQKRIYMGIKTFDKNGKELAISYSDDTEILRAVDPDDTEQAELDKMTESFKKKVADEWSRATPITVDADNGIYITKVRLQNDSIICDMTCGSFGDNLPSKEYERNQLRTNLSRMKHVWSIGLFPDETLALLAYSNLTFVWHFPFSPQPIDVSITAQGILFSERTRSEAIERIKKLRLF
ncbi:MAG: hypothetical protein MJZ74_02395 [Muribaculaceae bacterium]|nr:hypothetical protein [Muribaculaceae bacterium]